MKHMDGYMESNIMGRFLEFNHDINTILRMI